MPPATLGSSELRGIAASFHRALTEAASERMPLPGDEYLDARLRELRCPQALLAFYRDRIRKMKVSEVFESSSYSGEG